MTAPLTGRPVISATGLFTPPESISNEELVTSFNTYAARYGTAQPFSAAPEAQQIAWLQEVEKTPFFSAMRRLTVLGLIALPKYGGNRDYLGWQLIGVEDNHAWEPPFGYYDIDYPGFEPYPGTKPYTAFVQSELDTWTQVIKTAGIKPQ